ncbi:hypothetical protein FACS1894132_07200 [Clostridia bacterium]|nr:hypothetical protein FACS1894132_07200 [Clostridia bacterium]
MQNVEYKQMIKLNYDMKTYAGIACHQLDSANDTVRQHMQVLPVNY